MLAVQYRSCEYREPEGVREGEKTTKTMIPNEGVGEGGVLYTQLHVILNACPVSTSRVIIIIKLADQGYYIPLQARSVLSSILLLIIVGYYWGISLH